MGLSERDSNEFVEDDSYIASQISSVRSKINNLGDMDGGRHPFEYDDPPMLELKTKTTAEFPSKSDSRRAKFHQKSKSGTFEKHSRSKSRGSDKLLSDNENYSSGNTKSKTSKSELKRLKSLRKESRSSNEDDSDSDITDFTGKASEALKHNQGKRHRSRSRNATSKSSRSASRSTRRSKDKDKSGLER